MEPRSHPENASPSPDDFPGLYRAVLDAAAELDRRGARRASARLRREAAEAYAVWDEHGRRRLLALLESTRSGRQEPIASVETPTSRR